MTFGQYLKRERKAKGINQRTLANQVGVNFSYISKIESDTLPAPSEECLNKIAIALDLNIKDVMTVAKRIPDDVRQELIDNPQMIEIIKLIKKKKVTLDQIKEWLTA